MKTFFKIFILFFVTSCANMIAPSGGPRDNESPKVSKTQISLISSYFKRGSAGKGGRGIG